MKIHHLPLTLLAALAAPLWAGEITVEKKPFQATVSFDGTFLPSETHLLAIDPEAWSDFTIVDLVPQGEMVKKGDQVVEIDTEAIDQQLADDVDATRLRKMALANAERELENLEKSTPWKLDVAEKAYQRAKEDYQYFKEVGRPLQEESAKRSLESAERYLEYATEELNQLLKMYKEDDLTEETEEIILKRQRYQVDAAEFRLKTAKLDTVRDLEVSIPRSALDREQALKDAELAWVTQRESLPRALEQKRLEVKKLRVEDERADEKSAKLKADRAAMEVRAPANGRIYYGEINDGKWDAGNAAKFMKPGGKIPAKTVFATVIPSDASLQVHAFVDEKLISRIEKGQSGYVAPGSAPRARLGVKVASAASYPAVDGNYHIVLDVTGEADGLHLVPGMKGKVTLTTSPVGERLSVPVKALHEEPDGSYTVEVKEGDQTKKVAVTVGSESNGQIVVRSGLQPGQVVIVPEAEKSDEEEKK